MRSGGNGRHLFQRKRERKWRGAKGRKVGRRNNKRKRKKEHSIRCFIKKGGNRLESRGAEIRKTVHGNNCVEANLAINQILRAQAKTRAKRRRGREEKEGEETERWREGRNGRRKGRKEGKKERERAENTVCKVDAVNLHPSFHAFYFQLRPVS